VTTLNDLIATIHSSLHSFSGTQEQVTWLTNACDEEETTLSVASTESVMRGLAEIDDELVYVHSSDTGGLVLPPFGRGYRGTTAAAHAVNAAVTFDPVFPRAEIRRAVDQIIESLFPILYQIKTTTFTYDASKLSFELPADCEGVIAVKEEDISSTDYWGPLARWNFDPNSELSTGRAISVLDVVNPSAEVQVIYRAKFDTFEAGTDTFADVGLSESYADLILYGVTARLIRFLDPARLQVASVESISRSQVVAAGDAGKVANQLYAMFQQRLSEERKRLLELDPPSIHFTR
jgi:hypothetical protein